jgi:hypothetical protein
MKLESDVITFDKSKPFTSEDFEIGDPALVIETLTKNMYSNPIRAGMQEIASNAKDANIEAGKPNEPIKVKLPNSFDATLSISDSGIGISPERVSQIYRKIGVSSKRSDNKQMGKFGYGSKSFWAYTTQFVVETTSLDAHFTDQHGNNHENCLVQRRYICTKEYPPKVNKIDEKLVPNGSTGTTVSIAVKISDLQRFHDEAVQLFKYWSVKPIIDGWTGFTWPEYKKVFEGPGYFLTDNGGSPTALLNDIPYPINTSLVHQEIIKRYGGSNTGYGYSSIYNVSTGNGQKSYHLQNMCSAGFVLIFDNGEISITASREAIDYREGVVEKLVDRLEEVLKDIEIKSSDKIKHAKTYWEAVWLHQEMCQATGNNKYFGDLKWNNYEISQTRQGRRANSDKYGLYNAEKTSRYSYRTGKNTTKIYVGKGQSVFIPTKGDIVVLDDTTNNAPSNARLETLWDTENLGDKTNVWIIKPMMVSGVQTTEKDAIDEATKELLLEGFSILKLSSYKPAKKTSAATGTTRTPSTVYLVKKVNIPNGYETGVSIDLQKETGYYVAKKYGSWYKDFTFNEEVSIYDITNLLSSSAILKPGENLYSISVKYKDKVGPNLKPIYSIIEQLIDAQVKKKDEYIKKCVANSLKTKKNYYGMNSNGFTSPADLLQSLKFLKIDLNKLPLQWQKFFDKIDALDKAISDPDYKTVSEIFSKYHNYLSKKNIDHYQWMKEVDKEVKKFQTEYETLINNRPLLKYINPSKTDSSIVSELLTYITKGV